MHQPIDYPTVQSRLRAELAHATRHQPAGCMQLRITSNAKAAVLWALSGRAGYATVWYDGDQAGATIHTRYLDALDAFCAATGMPPLDTGQQAARVPHQRTGEATP